MFEPIFKNKELVNKEEVGNLILEQAKRRGLNLNLKKPKTIQDKLNFLKIYGNLNLRGFCADKIKVHEYCIKKLGKDICVPILCVFDNPKDIHSFNFPEKFVLKCNHGWNMNLICKDKSNFDFNDAESKLTEWLDTSFGIEGYELHYLNIDRKCFVEKFLDGGENGLVDYKFWCFNGEPKLYTINSDNGHVNGSDIVYYDITGKEIPVYKKTENRKVFPKPKHFKEMIEYAKKLSSDFKFVRVDFYEVDNIVYLGELSFTPGACYFKYNEPWNKKIGDFLKL